MQPQLSKESANQIAVEYLKKRKNTEKVEVALIEAEDDCWMIRGTCPIEFGEMQWPEKFSVVVDSKGKIKSEDYGLL
jgi:ActR/RegA family two-component response regulator